MRQYIVSIVALAAIACGGAPKTQGERDTMYQQADSSLATMTTKDPSLRPLLNSAAGYAVFPNIGKGGFIAGAAHGRGVLYENGQPTGFVEMTQGSLGAQIGAQTFAELVVLRTPYDVQKLKSGNFSLGANVSAVVLTTGAGAAADTTTGVNVFIMPRGGVMAELSVSGQQITFQPAG
jgi:lipid-binding SYLF domain-containing protein